MTTKQTLIAEKEDKERKKKTFPAMMSQQSFVTLWPATSSNPNTFFSPAMSAAHAHALQRCKEKFPPKTPEKQTISPPSSRTREERRELRHAKRRAAGSPARWWEEAEADEERVAAGGAERSVGESRDLDTLRSLGGAGNPAVFETLRTPTRVHRLLACPCGFTEIPFVPCLLRNARLLWVIGSGPLSCLVVSSSLCTSVPYYSTSGFTQIPFPSSAWLLLMWAFRWARPIGSPRGDVTVDT